ncbi:MULTISPECIES: bifunctional transcriptional activator/DNA repair enzyme AdaA [unclassified Nocardia]|uniref:bifunctional transcriptional activator/DNA repair enzyme AdaA n=1 Tax=unclassified Nocardia TaxID=2637762 RepID=UPI001CE41119|nr:MULTISPECIES: helix-turn-helix domain-containing protein [unclassified Nocardia]
MGEFTGVVTTGIYCRPGCAGRPKPENVRVFTTAAAAEAAGFRACLRCRPYRGAPPVGPPGAELVCRAVRLIVDGALDEHGEADLAARLGVSARHLRRLFAAALGLNPDQLARSSRAHFARRLLDDTDMSIVDAAFAAGYGSVRQFNRACREIFHAPPSELRARRRTSDRLIADGGVLLRLGYLPAPEQRAVLDYLTAHAIPGVEHVTDNVYRRTIRSGRRPGVLEIIADPGGDLFLRAHVPDLRGLIHHVQRARHIFEPDHRRTAASRLAESAVLSTPGTWDGYETAVHTLIARDTNAANILTGRLVTRYGTRVPGLHPMGLSHLFPPPPALAEADLSARHRPTPRNSPHDKGIRPRSGVLRHPPRPKPTRRHPPGLPHRPTRHRPDNRPPNSPPPRRTHTLSRLTEPQNPDSTAAFHDLHHRSNARASSHYPSTYARRRRPLIPPRPERASQLIR